MNASANIRRSHILIFFIAWTLLLFGFVTWKGKLTNFKFSAIVQPASVFNSDTAVTNENVEYRYSSHVHDADLRVEAFGTQFVRTRGTAFNTSALSNAVTKEQLIDTSQLDAKQGFDYITSLAVQNKLDFRRVARYPVEEDWLTPMDIELLEEEPVRDLGHVAQATHSTINLVPWPPEGKAQIGSNVTVRVDLKDGIGRPVEKGGHLLRIWMVQQTTGVKRAIAADVTDLGNGSYVTTLPVLWRGRIEVKAALLRSRELQRLVLSLTRTMKFTCQVVGVFSNGDTEQATLCSFIPAVPGFHELCNLTEYNFGLPWYCGKPTKPGLRCDQWKRSHYTAYPRVFKAPADQALLTHPTFKTGLHRLLNTVFFSSTGKFLPPAIRNDTCVPLKPIDSWSDHSPRGYWEKADWIPLIGCPLLEFDIPTTAKYLRDTQIIFIGDSNARFLLQHMVAVLKCKSLPGGHPLVANHVQRYATCKESNSTMTWIQHAFPYLCGKGPCEMVNEKYAPAAIMDKVPNTGKYVFIVHLFMHFAPIHNAIYAQHVRHTVQGIRNLLARNPDVHVFLRSPHGLCDDKFVEFSDYHAKMCMAVLQHEFRDVRDRVMLLNDWDMTIAAENCDIHPAAPISQTLSRMIVSHMARTQG